MDNQNNIEDKLKDALANRKFEIKAAWQSDMDARLNALGSNKAGFFRLWMLIPLFILSVGTYCVFNYSDETQSTDNLLPASFHENSQSVKHAFISENTSSENQSALDSKESPFSIEISESNSAKNLTSKNGRNGTKNDKNLFNEFSRELFEVNQENQALQRLNNSKNSQSEKSTGQKSKADKTYTQEISDSKNRINNDENSSENNTGKKSKADKIENHRTLNSENQLERTGKSKANTGGKNTDGVVTQKTNNSKQNQQEITDSLDDFSSSDSSSNLGSGDFQELTTEATIEKVEFLSMDMKIGWLTQAEPKISFSAPLYVPHIKRKKLKTLELYTGVSNSRLTGGSFNKNIDLTSSEEISNLNSPMFGLRLRIKNTVTTGLEISPHGETYSSQDTTLVITLEDNSFYEFEYDNFWQVDSILTDSTIFIDSTLVEMLIDSTFIEQIDSTYTESLSNKTQKNRYTYLNIPIGYEFNLIYRSKFRLTITPEVYIGIRVKHSESTYLGEAFKPKLFTFSYGGRVSGYYNLNSRFFTAAHLSFKSHLLNTDNEFDRRYLVFSGQLGVGFRF